MSDSEAKLSVSVRDTREYKALMEEALDAECRHAGEPWAGEGRIGCSDECGGCRVRTLAFAIVNGEWTPDA